MKRLAVHFVLLIVGGYTLLFALSSQSYERRWTQFQQKSNAIYTRIISNNPDRATGLLPVNHKTRHANRPRLWKPKTVFCQFVCTRGIDAEMQKNLIETVIFFKSDLSQVRLSMMDLSGAHIDLRRAKLMKADLSSTNLSEAKLNEANLSGAMLKSAKMVDTALRGADLSGADLMSARLSGADLQGARLSDADLTRADFRGAKLSGADLRGVNFFYSDFVGADLQGADLRRVDLSGADFRKVNFKGAKLTNAILGGARLNQANLSEAELVGVDLRHADLSESIGLTQAQLKNIIVDGKTRFPEGFPGPESIQQ